VLQYKGVTSKEFRRYLEKLGCVIIPGKGSHHEVLLGTKRAVLPMHGKKEMGTGLVNKIKKDLGLK
jgi:mRNA interferase HicA